ncbi:MAG: T9SS type A sorting domain-containing protein [Candidatus Symbiothrix sp.]|nr:T9SS type A sorting domain-containing protein [Candidatus Symbiothrix sp.]
MAQKTVHLNTIAENENVNLPSGIYIVQIQHGEKSAVHKVLVK